MQTHQQDIFIKPFLPWIGGKQSLYKYINAYKPDTFNNYYEPFVGAGTVFINLQHSKTYINDLNTELINTYEVIRDNVCELISILTEHNKKNSKEYFYQIRDWDRDGTLEHKSKEERAGRFIYLIKNGYKNIYRVNSKGECNTFFVERKYVNTVNADVLINHNKLLNKMSINITNEDFATAVAHAQKGDFIYFDPPYAPLDEHGRNFCQYTKTRFGYQEQVRLRDLFIELDKKGCYVMLSNSSSKVIHELYSNYSETTHIINVRRRLSTNANSCSKVNEVIITNYKSENQLII